MSLINSMLRDLDARKSDGPGAGQFQQHVRAVPDRHDNPGRRRIALAGAAVVALVTAAGGALWLNSTGKALPFAVLPAAQPVVAVVAAAPAAVPTAVAATIPPQETAALSAAAPALPVTAPAAPPPFTAQATVPVAAAVPTTTLALKKETESAIPPRNSVVADAARAAIAPAAGASANVKPAPAVAVAVAVTSVAAPESASKNTPPPPLPQKRMSESSPQERADNEYLQAIELLRQGKQGAAIQGLEQAVRMSARHDAARQTLVASLIDMGRKDDAIKYAQEGLADHIAQPSMAMTLARLQVEKGEVRPAIATLERTLAYSAGRTDYEAFLAALLQRDEQHKQAVEHYLVALQKAPEAGVWWMGLGISYQALQRSGEALEAFKRAKASSSLNAELSAFVDTRLGQLQR